MGYKGIEDETMAYSLVKEERREEKKLYCLDAANLFSLVIKISFALATQIAVNIRVVRTNEISFQCSKVAIMLNKSFLNLKCRIDLIYLTFLDLSTFSSL